MVGYDDKKSLGAVWSACPLLGLSSRAGCENDHTWCPMSALIFCLCLSISPPSFEREPVIPPPSLTHKHTLWHTYAHKEDGLIQRQESSRLLSVCFLLLHLPFPLTKTWLIHCLHLPTGWDRQREVQKAPWPSQATPFYFPRDFPHPSTDLRFVLTFCEITQVWRW